AVGITNTSYYNKIFKKFMDCTPTEYRTSIKKHIK
ncbi:MAG: AraC family transcriptional regulator, partial [Lachnospiraceae bacterium]|nr:AraC family transcriptional regulator [Lachnospiraceae bacterium]